MQKKSGFPPLSLSLSFCVPNASWKTHAKFNSFDDFFSLAVLQIHAWKPRGQPFQTRCDRMLPSVWAGRQFQHLPCLCWHLLEAPGESTQNLVGVESLPWEVIDKVCYNDSLFYNTELMVGITSHSGSTCQHSAGSFLEVSSRYQ